MEAPKHGEPTGAVVSASDPDAERLAVAIDPTVDPCRDFYAFACGGVSPDASVEDEMYMRLDDAIYAWMTDPEVGQGTTAEIRRFMAACRDETSRAELGLQALARELEAVDTVMDRASFLRAVGVLQSSGVGSLFSFRRFPVDARSVDSALLYGPADAPPREVVDAPDGSEEGAAWRNSIAAVLELTGEADQAASVARFEAELTRAQPEDTSVPIAQWARDDWQPYLDALGVELQPNTYVVGGGYPERAIALIDGTPPEVLRAYLRYKLWRSLDHDLPPEHWAQRPFQAGTNAYCQIAATTHYDVHLAQAFGREMLGEGERARARAMAESMRTRLLEELGDASWVDPAAREGARAIVEQIDFRVGWLDTPWGPLPEADRRDHLANVLAMRRHAFAAVTSPDYDVQDGLLWDEMQFLATAWNDPYAHTVNVGLGILQAPLFDARRPQWLDLASLGAVLGHELHHSIGPAHFADHLEHLGRPVSLAAPVDEGHECLADAFADAGVTFPYEHLEENYADIGGYRVALSLYRESLPEPKPRMASLGSDALFFVGAAQLFCMPPTEAGAERREIARARINGSFSAMPEFAQAYACEPNEPMRVDHDCETW